MPMPLLRSLLAGLALCSMALADPSRSTVRFDFESGDLHGWRIVEGDFGELVCDRATFHNRPERPYNKQGKYYLTTLETPKHQSHDAYTGVVESPVFTIRGETATMIVGGGSHKTTYVALCTADGKEVRRACGKKTETMQPVTWDVAEFAGRKLFLRVVDRHTGGWGHITFDDFSVPGEIDPDATRIRWEVVERRRLDAERKQLTARLDLARRAVDDMRATFAERFADADAILQSFADLRRRIAAVDLAALDPLRSDVDAACRRALLANPLVRRHPIVFVTRPQYKPDHHATATMFQNGEINTASFQGGGAIKTIDLDQTGKVETLLSLPKGVARDLEVSFDGDRLLFSMRRDRSDDYHICEMTLADREVRQLTTGSQLADIDPMYLPDGRILFASTREPKLCQCNRHIMANLFRMNGDGSGLHQIGRNTLFEGHPALMPDGTVLYDRWEYVDKHFGPAFGLWTVNPDGTNHAIFYGNNAWSPGAIMDARPVPGTHLFVATFGSCHDRPWGAIALVDRTKGLDGLAPVQRSWPTDIADLLSNDRNYPNTGRRGHPAGWQIDTFRRLKTKYEDPFPLSETYFLCSRMVCGEQMGLFLIDVFGNETLIHTEQPGCFDPMPLCPRRRPPVVPDRKHLERRDGSFYVVDVYTGTGMERVPRGTIQWLRVVEAPPKLFWTHTLWNIDATQAPAMNYNCTSNKQILGKVPVEPDGSAYFDVPADKFVFFQLLDKDDRMVQSMRSGTMVQPGERLGCVGCHENRLTTTPPDRAPLAMRRAPSRIEPWYGPPRVFNYLTEVQPVFDKHCVRCHDFDKPAGKKLNLAGDQGLVFNTSYVELRSKSAVRWFPDPPGAEKLLVKAVDDGPPEALPPYAWGSHRSRLVDVIMKPHHDVKLAKEARDRIIAWIDMNAPYYGSYASAYRDNPFGRSPLSNDDLKRLRQLTGVKVGDQAAEMKTSTVCFDRPEKSPCLDGLRDKDPKRYARALAIIRSGQQRLAARPRMDMPGAKLLGIEADRQAKYDRRAQAEARARRELARPGPGEATTY